MIVACPTCETKFAVPDDAYRPGRKARCSNCAFVFPLPEMDGEDALPPEPPFESGVPEPKLPDAPDSPGSPEGPESADADTEPPPPPASIDDIVFTPPDAPPPPKSRKKLVLAVACIVLCVMLGYGGYALFSASSKPEASPGSADAAPETDAAKEAARLAAVGRLTLTAPQQYIEKANKKTGPIIVIAGSVTNNFDTPKSLILLEVTLFDDKGKALVAREQYCGVTLPPLQLRTLSKDALEKALNSEVIILTNNADILPGASVPFMTLFFGYPEAVYEFEVKLIDAQDAAQQR